MTAPETRSAAPAEALAARFREALGRLRPGGGRIGLAVSGGPDSLALLLLAEAAVPGQFEVATVDHGLRADSADECAMVQAVCDARGIRCATLKVAVARGNVQALARAARYAALARWANERGLAAIATAHHADDQAETFLMRLNRGSGVAGLAGVREHGVVPGSAVPLIRPLLSFRRAELDRLVRGAGLSPARDPSNADERFDRVRIRQALAANGWLDAAAVAASAAHLAEAGSALAWAAAREWDERVRTHGDELRYAPAAPRAIVLRVLERVIGELGQPPRGKDLARLLDRLEKGAGGNLAGVLASVEGREWVFRPEPPRRAG